MFLQKCRVVISYMTLVADCVMFSENLIISQVMLQKERKESKTILIVRAKGSFIWLLVKIVANNTSTKRARLFRQGTSDTGVI